ncbi:Asp-tRNA(Asn)/Glu-tRNA(Gln) amidotransferase subunit GatC [Corynebacterium ulceribovis]|uniref:Asp-tRNA(Asn)/Glu-tRNA(Gln) amidotransferase subunit GatC n=1 Tax=Corynebacterium ulceribovis TaxID=487732 RepID=UPI0003656209|nr:Asp-tRNA(Asn)/Glu-tRNA(Gln) amidotransferase subunit GatC [Corynebacterium ulceribovis]
MSEISRDQVAHLAKLSRLAIPEDEMDHYAEQLDSIIGHISSIADVKEAADVEPMSHPAALFAAMRDDVVEPGLTAEQALDQAPSVDQDRFEVPQILGE